MHLDIERIGLARFERFGIGHRFALRTTQSGTRDLCHLPSGATSESRANQFARGASAEACSTRMRSPHDCQFLLQRSRIIYQAERVHGPLVGEQFSPPEAGFHADRRNILQPMKVAQLRLEPACDSPEGKAWIASRSVAASRLDAPFPGHGFQIRIGRKPMAHKDDELWILQHPGIASLQPIVPPADSIFAPLDARAEVSIVRIGMVPWST